jgi:hypothetical protein
MLAVVGIAAVAAVVVSPARAATFQVTNTNDSGAGSLRQAIADANAAPGADTITFAVTGTIRLTSGMLVVNGDLTIDGRGADVLTVSGNRASRILAVTFASPPRLEVHDITLADSLGSAIVNVGGIIDVRNSHFSGNGSASAGGGAIQNLAGTVTVTDSTFAGNSALVGGAIESSNGATLTVANSTFSGNTAQPGGAISNSGATAAITNSTFAGNSAGGGGALYNAGTGTMRVTNSTFAGNTASSTPGGAIHNAGLTILVENSIFAGNGCVRATDGGGNLSWPESNCPGINADPRLGALADNGGPTQTMALGPGSAAIDTALAASCPATDQRGVARPQGAGCDIGAYESDVVDTSPPVITVPSSVVVNASSPAGAVVSYAASAVDDIDGPVAVVCVPPSGSTFAIGTTLVECSASDAAGNEASASFDVLVKGAEEQLDDLIALVTDLTPGTSLADKLQDARAALGAEQQAEACEKLLAFSNETQAQSGKKLTAAQAAQMIEAATRIRAVIGC